jgi:competence protein ComEA
MIGVILLVETRAPSAGPVPDAGLVVDLNRDPAAVISTLPRIGPVLVGRIIAARERGPFAALDDFDRRVHGIGPATIAAIRPFVTTDPIPTPVGDASRFSSSIHHEELPDH